MKTIFFVFETAQVQHFRRKNQLYRKTIQFLPCVHSGELSIANDQNWTKLMLLLVSPIDGIIHGPK